MKYLGKQTSALASESPETFELEAVPFERGKIDALLVARFVCPEFTSLCPVTGQPDFAHFVIDYVPNQHIIESKSLKLYLTTFRNYGHFHEACTRDIYDKIASAANPYWMRVTAFWYPRGGIPIDVFIQSTEPPVGLYVPEPGVSPYRGRG